MGNCRLVFTVFLILCAGLAAEQARSGDIYGSDVPRPHREFDERRCVGILGAVGRPGVYGLGTDAITIGDVIQTAGEATGMAGGTIRLLRGGQVELGALATAHTIRVQAGDVVLVDSKGNADSAHDSGPIELAYVGLFERPIVAPIAPGEANVAAILDRLGQTPDAMRSVRVILPGRVDALTIDKRTVRLPLPSGSVLLFAPAAIRRDVIPQAPPIAAIVTHSTVALAQEPQFRGFGSFDPQHLSSADQAGAGLPAIHPTYVTVERELTAALPIPDSDEEGGGAMRTSGFAPKLPSSNEPRAFVDVHETPTSDNSLATTSASAARPKEFSFDEIDIDAINGSRDRSAVLSRFRASEAGTPTVDSFGEQVPEVVPQERRRTKSNIFGWLAGLISVSILVVLILRAARTYRNRRRQSNLKTTANAAPAIDVATATTTPDARVLRSKVSRRIRGTKRPMKFRRASEVAGANRVQASSEKQVTTPVVHGGSPAAKETVAFMEPAGHSVQKTRASHQPTFPRAVHVDLQPVTGSVENQRPAGESKSSVIFVPSANSRVGSGAGVLGRALARLQTQAGIGGSRVISH